MARPTKLSPEIEERIVSAVRAGTSIAGAAAYAGIDPSTFHRWMERGDPKRTGRADGRYREFRARVEQASGEAEVRDVTVIAKAAPSDWRAAAWRLERRRPERYGRAAVEETLPDAPIAEQAIFNPNRLDREEKETLRRLLSKGEGRPLPAEEDPDCSDDTKRFRAQRRAREPMTS